MLISVCSTFTAYTAYQVKVIGATAVTKCLLTWFCSSHYARLIFQSNGFDPDGYTVLHSWQPDRSKCSSKCTCPAGMREIQSLRRTEGRETCDIGNTVTRLRAEQLRNPGSITGKEKTFFSLRSVQTGFGTHPAPYSMGIGGSFLGIRRPKSQPHIPRCESPSYIFTPHMH